MKTSTRLAGALALGLILPAAGLLASAGLSPATAPSAHAQTVATGQAGPAGADAFVRDAGHGGQFELQSGRLAVERTRNVEVRGYAVRTLRGADEMMNRVKFINSANVGAPMPTGLTADQQETLKLLAGLTGLDFDRAYMQSQIEVGELLRKTCHDYGLNGESPTLRVYATKAVIHYDAQLVQARAIAAAL